MIFMSSQIWNRLIPSVTCRMLISFFSFVFLFSVISGHPKGRSVVPCLHALCGFMIFMSSQIRNRLIPSVNCRTLKLIRRPTGQPESLRSERICASWIAVSSCTAFNSTITVCSTSRSILYYPGKKVSHPCTY